MAKLWRNRDFYSSTVVGWAMPKRMSAQLVEDALRMAIWKRQPSQWLLVHSNQGSQYASERYQKALKDPSFICSVSRQGCCWDNSQVESTSHPLKTELTHHRRYQTREKAQQEIPEYSAVFYNRQRHHSLNSRLSNPIGL